ncbi:MAG: DNA topoisomerase VI subunit B [Methanosphaera stadtmanae]|nr:DNA topoisomerase VI subunit B [Methanosphaera stadtmanae]
MERDTSELFEEFKELTASEFFRRNKQMLGFSGKIRSLTIVFHELITNSLDACEEAGILPEITIELKKLGKEHYLLKHADNGPGIPENYITKVYCQMFAGSKFRNIQSRGQQGLGCSGCVLLSQMTTGQPVKVRSRYKDGETLKGVEMTLKLDVKNNTGIILNKKEFETDRTGSGIEIEFKDVSYSMSEQGAYEYIRRTVIGNPHAKIIFKDPTGNKYTFERATDQIPPLPKEVLPHPKGVTADDIINLCRTSNKKRFKNLLMDSLSRVSSSKVQEVEDATGIDMKKRPKSITWKEAEAVVKQFDQMKFMAPPTNGLKPIGDEQIEKGINEILLPEFSTAITRKPQAYRGGVSFIIEAGIAYGGNAGRLVGNQRKAEIMRFANRVPLTFDQGSCAITEALKSIDWRRYGVRDLDNAPISVFVNIISTNVPYLSTGKQSVAPEPEIVKEIRQATMKIARRLEKYIRTKRAAKNEEMRAKIFEDLVPVVIKQSAILAEKDVPEYDKIMDEVTHKAKIMDMKNRLKQPEIEPMQVKMEQANRFKAEPIRNDEEEVDEE